MDWETDEEPEVYLVSSPLCPLATLPVPTNSYLLHVNKHRCIIGNFTFELILRLVV